MKPVVDAAKDLDKKMTEVEEALYQTKNRSPQDPLNFPIRLNDKLNGVAGSASLGDSRPTAQALQVRNELTAAIDAQLAKLRGIWDTDLAAFNELAREKGVGGGHRPPGSAKIDVTGRADPTFSRQRQNNPEMDVITKTFPTYSLSGWDLSELLPEPSEEVFAARLADLEAAVAAFEARRADLDPRMDPRHVPRHPAPVRADLTT